jgi:fusion and transport protein UGO1
MDSNEEDSYFADPSSSSRTRKYLKPQPVDEQGYVVRKSVMEDGTRPEYIIPVGSASGVWNMIKHVGRFRMEGWTSLWKGEQDYLKYLQTFMTFSGLLTYTLHEGIFINIEPIIRSSLRSLVMPHLIPYSYSSSILFPLASQIATGIFLSPLHLVRTRLIVQSGSSRHARYSGPIDALKQIARDEGGVRGMYFHPQILIPTVLERGTSALVALALPRALTMVLGFSHIAPDTHPLIWTAAECVASAVGLLMTLPLETVRHRLEVQVRGQAKPLRTCVETRPAPYNGVVDAMWHILTEERSDLPIKPRRRLRRRQSAGGDAAEEQKRREQEAAAESWWKHTGLGQLYRGVGLRATAGLVVLFAGMLNGGDEPELGWTEL